MERRLLGKRGAHRDPASTSGGDGGQGAQGRPARLRAANGEQPPTNLAAAWDGDDLTVFLAGELDCATAPAVSALVAQLLAEHSPRRLVLDLAEVRFIDCAGLRPIIRACGALPAGQRLILRSPARPVRFLLAATGLDQVCLIER